MNTLSPARSHAAGRSSGFTLIEMIIAIGLLSLLMGGVYQFYVMSLQARQIGKASTQQALLARVILTQMADEIRQAASQRFDSALKGDRREIWILAAGLPSRDLLEIRSVRDNVLPGEHDVRRLHYFLHSDEDVPDEAGDPYVFGLVRFEEKTLNSTALRRGGEGDEEGDGEAFSVKLYAPEIKYLEFRYSDGSSDRWLKRWEGDLANTIPQAVRITVGFVSDPEALDNLADESDIFEDEDEDLDTPHPDRYTVEVRLPTAGSPLGSVMLRGRSSRGGRS